MSVCDAHGAVRKTEKQMSPGEGYLLAARFVQRSVIQDKLIDRDMPMMQRMGITREQYRLQVESMQGASPWLICNECIGVLNLSQADKDAAREAAERFSIDKSTPGHVPGSRVKATEKKPAYFAIFGNGFTPSEEKAKSIILAWLEKRKAVLGTDAVVGVRSDLRFRPQAPRMQFVEVVSEVQKEHPGQVIDDMLMLDQRTGKDIALVAVWPPEATAFIQTLLKPEKKQGSQQATLERVEERKRWWEFWK